MAEMQEYMMEVVKMEYIGIMPVWTGFEPVRMELYQNSNGRVYAFPDGIGQKETVTWNKDTRRYEIDAEKGREIDVII